MTVFKFANCSQVVGARRRAVRHVRGAKASRGAKAEKVGRMVGNGWEIRGFWTPNARFSSCFSGDVLGFYLDLEGSADFGWILRAKHSDVQALTTLSFGLWWTLLQAEVLNHQKSVI